MIDSTGPNLTRRTARLAEYTVLTEAEAAVQARLEHDFTDEELTQELRISEEELQERKESLDETRQQVLSTIHMLPDLADEIDDDW